MALKYEWGFYPRWNYIAYGKDGKDQWAPNVIKIWEISEICIICFYIYTDGIISLPQACFMK